jgi:hypothetical protein
VTAIADELYARGTGIEIHLLGDCVQPRSALDATQDAAALAHRL